VLQHDDFSCIWLHLVAASFTVPPERYLLRMPSMRTSLLKGLAVAAAAPALFAIAPAQAAPCVGNGTLGGIQTGSGANCGTLAVGESFAIDVTSFFADLGTNPFDATNFGIGIVKGTGAGLSFSNVLGRVTGIAGGTPFTNAPIAIWGGENTLFIGTGPDNPFGSAPSGPFPTTNYLASNPGGALNAYREVAFSFGSAFGGFGSGKASPTIIGLTQVDSFIIEGTLTGNTDNTNTIISFGVGTSGTPTEGSTVGGFYSVPGPLPLAGAGAAFAWSRSLRRRIKASKVSASN
jgi:hypothetical protein